MASTKEEAVTLDWFVGKEFELSGVQESQVRHPGADDAATHFTFVLDGRAYTAAEDPSDGYRSSLERVFRSPAAKVTNRFPPVRVRGTWSDDMDGASGEVVQFKDCVTGRVVITVGTHNHDDYYPCFVGSFAPDNMVINRSEEERQLALQEDMAAVKARDGQGDWGTW
ncbi:hypothetical protein N5B55_04835 [Ralstonia pickettii]|uniref:hypothetical protein n=1 Tax=Ralstonia pickettii TaxID=329 RepID=UPI0027150276|nr:hypothetical protein [Ralstonia pickettii]WKZ86279.1 hypothetical protein N5B55_04835 [Ralstonia pickettii]